MVESADFLRFVLATPPTAFVLLADEVAVIEGAWAIEKAWFEERLVTEVTIDDAARAVPIPPSVLLPLLESACHHGRPGADVVRQIKVAIEQPSLTLRCGVATTGTLDSTSSGLGAGRHVLRDRLACAALPAEPLTVECANGWVVATLTIPIEPPPAASHQNRPGVAATSSHDRVSSGVSSCPPSFGR